MLLDAIRKFRSALAVRSTRDTAASITRLTESSASPVRDACTRKRLADVLAQLGEVIRAYGSLLQAMPAGSESLESQLAAQLAETHRLQDLLAELLEPRAGAVPVAEAAGTEWPLRGEILVHVDRLRTGLTANSIPRQRRQPAARPPKRARTRAARQRPAAPPIGRDRP
jgi:hypothetical protein